MSKEYKESLEKVLDKFTDDEDYTKRELVKRVFKIAYDTARLHMEMEEGPRIHQIEIHTTRSSGSAKVEQYGGVIKIIP